MLNFNPRSREGNDRPHLLIALILPYFNPRSREGNDVLVQSGAGLQKDFNPRSREGNDSSCLYGTYDKVYFNPRSREGNDVNNFVITPSVSQISIHVPAKGTTTELFLMVDSRAKFQSTFPRRERLQNKQFPPLIFRHFHLNIRATCLYCALFLFFNCKRTQFVHFFWCESPRVFMFTSGSHYIINVSSNVIRPSTPIRLTLTLQLRPNKKYRKLSSSTSMINFTPVPARERTQNRQFLPLIFRHFHLNIRETCLHYALFSFIYKYTQSEHFSSANPPCFVYLLLIRTT